MDDAADARATVLATGIGRLGVRLGVEYQSAARSTGWRTARHPGGLSVRVFVEEPSVEDLTAAALAGGHIATRTPRRTRTIQEGIPLVRIALV